MKKWDYIVASFAVMCLVGSFFLSAAVLIETDGVPMVQIFSDQRLVYEKEFTPTLKDAIRVESEWGYNQVVIDNGDIYIHDADCSDKTCTKNWHIKRIGQYIFCLPHRLIVEVKGVSVSAVDDVSQ
jgi:hypothetical protein